MILLCVNIYLLWGSSITDWLQAFGAIVAIVGVCLGWRQIRKDSKEKQSQIDRLTELAKHSKKANELFKSQIEEDKRRHKLNIKPKFKLSIVNEKSFNQRYYTLQNIGGGEAQNIVIERFTKSSIETYIDKHIFLNYLLKDKTADIIFEAKKDTLNSPSMDNFEVNTKIYFKDIDGNMYSQTICGSHKEDNFTSRYLQMTEPVDIDIDSVESTNGFIL